jgi:Xaa-Pro aminopeptidase
MSARRDRCERALEVARALGAVHVLTSNPATVAWLTGYAPTAETGPDPYSLPPLVLLSPGEPPKVYCASDRAGELAALGCVPLACGGQTNDEIRRGVDVADAIAVTVAQHRTATERFYLPDAIGRILDIVDATAELARLRVIKDIDEIALLRHSIAICDAGQRAARDALEPGVTELELWSAALNAMETTAGSRLTAVADVISGERSRAVSGDPSSRVIAAQDPVIVDLLPRFQGYWGDSTSTLTPDPTTELKTAWGAVSDVLNRLIERVRPGTQASELDELARSKLRYPHHTGHGLGTTYHEEPRIVPEATSILEAGMVIALEPAVYTETLGLRLEVVVLVTEDGADVLSGHTLEL